MFNFKRKDFLLILFIIFVYFLSRLINLDKFPVFCDEGIYIHWAKIAWHDAAWRFISLTDGKQPLQTWLTIPFLKLFPNNALLAGRLFSVSAGLASLIGLFALVYYLFGKKAAFISSFLYVLTPFFLFYDRMALTDSAVNAGFIWVLFFSILLVKTLRLDVALLFGLVAGMALLTKSSIQMFIALSLLAPIIIVAKSGIKKNIKKIINFSALYLVVVFLAFVIYNVQRLSPYLHYVAIKNTTFLMTFSEFIKAPFSLFWGNFKIVPLYIFWESGWLLPVLGLLGLINLSKKDKGLFLYFFAWLIIPFLVITSISKVVFPRYLVFFASLFVIFASYFIANLKKNIFLIIFSVFLIVILYLDYPILFDFKSISFPEVDRGQYIEGVPAGWQVDKLMEYARKKSAEKPVIIMAEGNFGVIGDMLDVFLKPNDRIEVQGYWPLDEKNLIENQKELKDKYVYIVFSHRTEFPGIWPIKLIKKIEKPGKKSAIYLFQLVK